MVTTEAAVLKAQVWTEPCNALKLYHEIQFRYFSRSSTDFCQSPCEKEKSLHPNHRERLCKFCVGARFQIGAKEALIRDQAARLAELEALRAEATALRNGLAAARAEALGHEQRASAVPVLTAELSSLKSQV